MKNRHHTARSSGFGNAQPQIGSTRKAAVNVAVRQSRSAFVARRVCMAPWLDAAWFVDSCDIAPAVSRGPEVCALHAKRQSSESPGCQEYRPISIGLALPPLTIGISGR